MDKLRIVICDDNLIEAKSYTKLCRDSFAKHNMLMNVKIYTSSRELLSDMESGVLSSLVSIMIVDPEQGFADVPAAIREKGYDGLIIYLSHSNSVALYQEAFDVGAFNFVQKDTDSSAPDRFQTVFEKALTAAKQLDRRYIVVNCGGEYRQIDISDIYYFETDKNHMINVEYRGGRFLFISSLQELEERMKGQGFIRVHRSYLVSLNSITKMSNNELTMSNGHIIPVSRNYSLALKKELTAWNL